MVSETRIVLVKPGDVLIFGNCGDLGCTGTFTHALESLKYELHLKAVLVFDEDIDLAVVPGVVDGEGA